MRDGEHDDGVADVVLIADQLLVELYRALVEPAQVLLGLDATDELEQRLVARVDIIATRLTTGDASERVPTADAIVAALHHDPDWWDTPLGRACREASRATT
jgi:hypothetical protein